MLDHKYKAYVQHNKLHCHIHLAMSCAGTKNWEKDPLGTFQCKIFTANPKISHMDSFKQIRFEDHLKTNQLLPQTPHTYHFPLFNQPHWEIVFHIWMKIQALCQLMKSTWFSSLYQSWPTIDCAISPCKCLAKSYHASKVAFQDSSHDIQRSSVANAKIGPPQNKMHKWALNLKRGIRKASTRIGVEL
jgi:hypothetical protein